ncbi:MAG: hypothetical protein AB1305_00525 [Candidatus Hadarchaeota archaeon]
MTLEETEFQRLVELLVELVERYQGNPAALEAIFSEFRDIYKKVPIYPGIISMLLPKVIQPAEMGKLEEGAEVLLNLKDGSTVYGTIAEITPTEIRLAESYKLTATIIPEKLAVGKDSVEEVRRISRELLAKEWPSLNFEVD